MFLFQSDKNNGSYSSHRLIMGKEEIDNFSVSMGMIVFLFYRNVFEQPLHFK